MPPSRLLQLVSLACAATAVQYTASFAVQVNSFGASSFKPRGHCDKTCKTNNYNMLSAVSDAMGVPGDSLRIIKAVDSKIFTGMKAERGATLSVQMKSSDMLQMGIVDNMLNNLVRREELKSELLQQFQIVGLNKITKVNIHVEKLQHLGSMPVSDSSAAPSSKPAASSDSTSDTSLLDAGVVGCAVLLLAFGAFVQSNRGRGGPQQYATLPPSSAELR